MACVPGRGPIAGAGVSGGEDGLLDGGAGLGGGRPANGGNGRGTAPLGYVPGESYGSTNEAGGVPEGVREAQVAYRIVINIPAYRLSLFRGGKLLKQYPIAVGKAVSPSRTGICTIVHKAKNPTWFPPDGGAPVPPGPNNPIGSRWMGLSWPGYGIHGTNNPASIGAAVSLGCIRMRDEDARELYDIIPMGTQVEFVYRTIEVQPGTGWQGPAGPHIAVYKDIYGRGSNTLERALAELKAVFPEAVPYVDVEALGAIVAAASGRPQPVPLKPRVEIDGRLLPPDAARLDASGDLLVAVRPVADALKCYVHWDQATRVAVVGGLPVRCVVLSGRAYASVGELQRAFITLAVDWRPDALALVISTRPRATASWAGPAAPPPVFESHPPSPRTDPEPRGTQRPSGEGPSVSQGRSPVLRVFLE